MNIIQKIFILLLLSTNICTITATNHIYVSIKGSDNAKGNIGHPLFSVNKAIDLSQTIQGQDTVYIHMASGTYHLEKPINLTPDNPHPLVIIGNEKEMPVISGGMLITGWKKTSNGWWKTTISEVKNKHLSFEQLFVNGIRAQRARTPDEGWFKVDSVHNTYIGGDEKGNGAQYCSSLVMTSPGNLKSLRGTYPYADSKVTAHFYFEWNTVHWRLEYIDNEHDRFLVSSQKMHPQSCIRKGSRFYVENYANALSSAGEWYLSDDGELTYIPREGEKPEETIAYAPIITQLVNINGLPEKPVRNVTFRNISFRHAANYLTINDNYGAQAAVNLDAAIMVNHAENINIDHCEIRQTGNYGIWFYRNCHHCTLQHCFLNDLGGGGIKIGSTVGNETSGGRNNAHDIGKVTSHIRVENNIIRKAGQVFPASVGVFILHGANNKVMHNEICDLHYSGVSIGWVWGYGYSPSINNEVAYNHIHHLGWGDLSDMGGVYTLGVSPGTTIHHNVIHDVLSQSYGGWGIYTDEGSSNILIENNLVYGCKCALFHQHYGKDNIIRNNIFAWGMENQLQFTKEEKHRSFTFAHNIVIKEKGNMLDGKWDVGKVDYDRNCYWSLEENDTTFVKKTFNEWKKTGKTDIFADPQFTDPLNGDFSFKSNKIIHKIGFKPFNIHTAGVIGTEKWKLTAQMNDGEIDKFNEVTEKILGYCPAYLQGRKKLISFLQI